MITHECEEEAVIIEWPEEITVLMTELFLKATCPTCDEPFNRMHVERKPNNNLTITVFCNCERSQV
jgi:hypothetical protein